MGSVLTLSVAMGMLCLCQTLPQTFRKPSAIHNIASATKLSNISFHGRPPQPGFCTFSATVFCECKAPLNLESQCLSMPHYFVRNRHEPCALCGLYWCPASQDKTRLSACFSRASANALPILLTLRTMGMMDLPLMLP